MIPLIDTHQHLIYRDISNYSWTKGIPPLAENSFTIQDYKNLTADLGVGGTIFMESGVDDPDYQKETNFVHSLFKDPENSLIGLIVSIRPEKDDSFSKDLEETIEMGATGYRRILHVESDDMSKSDTFRKNVRKMGDSGKTFDLCFLEKQLTVAIELAKACDNTTLILNHCGVPNIAGDTFESWSRDIKTISELPNVICKLSGLMAYCAPGTSNLDTIRPYVDHVLECFGAKRIVWGSDWPVVNLGKGLPEWIKVTREILSKLSEDEANAIANGTAKRVYKVNL